jgi:hypothetical protein
MGIYRTGKGPAPFSLSVGNVVSTTFSAEISSKVGWGQRLLQNWEQPIRELTPTKSHLASLKSLQTEHIRFIVPQHITTDILNTRQGLFPNSHIGTYEYKEPTSLYFYWKDTTSW